MGKGPDRKMPTFVERVFARKLALAAVVAASIVVATLAILLFPPVYRSEALLREGAPQAGDAIDPDAAVRRRQLAQQALEDASLAAAVDTLGAGSAEALRDATTIGSQQGDFRVTFEGTDPSWVAKAAMQVGASLIARADEQWRSRQQSHVEARKMALRAAKADVGDKQRVRHYFLADHPELAFVEQGPQTDEPLRALARHAKRLKAYLKASKAGAAGKPDTSVYDAKLASAEQAASKAREGMAATKGRPLQDVERVAANRRLKETFTALHEVSSNEPDGLALPPTTAKDRERLAAVLRRAQAAVRSKKVGDKAKELVAAVVRTESKWKEIVDAVEVVRERHRAASRVLLDAQLALELDRPSSIQVVTAAEAATVPIRRLAPQVGGVTGLVVLLLGLGWVIGMVIRDDTIYQADDLRRLSLGPIVHVIRGSG